MKTVLITGANRGLGLEFVKRYKSLGWRVLACCRNPDKAEELRGLADEELVRLYRLDVADGSRILQLSKELEEESIDLLLNNAGVYGIRSGFGNVDPDEWHRVMAVNAMAPMKITEAFVDQITRSERKMVVCITSKMGSIQDNSSGGSYIYRSSKAALNAVVKTLSVDLAPKSVICVAVHPGWVQTDMGGPHALIDTATSVKEMIRVIDSLKIGDSGRFLNYDGQEIPW